MDQMTLLYIIAAFVLVAAIALCMQAGFSFGMFMVAKRLEQRAIPLLPKVEALLESARSTVDHGRKQMIDIATKANDIMDSTKHQMAKVDEVVTDATSRAKVQMERVEMVLDDTMSRTHETVAMVHSGIIRPLREINGISAGIRTAISHFAKGARPSVAQVTSDEEMFI